MKCIECDLAKRDWGIVVGDDGVCADCLMGFFVQGKKWVLVKELDDFLSSIKGETNYWIYIQKNKGGI